MDPSSFEANFNLARLAYGRKDWARADALASDALRARPDAPDALVLAALLAERAGRAADAESLLARAVDASTDDAVARFDLARALARQGDLDGAARELRAYLRLEPEDSAARAWLSTLQSAGPR